MYSRQSRFTYSACRPFTRNKEIKQKFNETGVSQYIYRNKVDKACFQRDMAYGHFKDLPRRTDSDKIQRDKTFNITKNRIYGGNQCRIVSMIYKFFHKKSSNGGIKNENMSSQELAHDFHKPNIRKFEKRKAHSSFIYNIWGVDLADIELISKFNKGIRFLLCVVDVFSKYAWAVPLKDKEHITITDAFQKILDDFNRKPKKIWGDKGKEFCDTSMKPWLKDSNIETYSTHNEGKFIVAERFIWTL